MPKVDSVSVQYAKQLQDPPELGKPYSIPLPGTSKPGQTPIYRNWRFTDKLLETLDPKIRTCHDIFEETSRLVPKNKALGRRPWDTKSKTFGAYIWEDYGTIAQRRKDLGVGIKLLHERVGVTEGKYGVGLFCNNRPEWQISDLACMSQGLFTVSLYDTLGPDTTEYIINHADLTCVISSIDHVATLLRVKPNCPSLKLIICLDSMYDNDHPKFSKGDLLRNFAAGWDVQIHAFNDVEALGRKNPRPFNPPSPEDIITINYTSGTTGDPKGVVLLHKNAVAASAASLTLMEQKDEDCGVSFLPLAHIFQRLAEHMGMWGGGGIGYYHGEILEILEDLKLVRPTAFSGVPRLFNRIGAGIRLATLEKPANPIRGALSKYLINMKLEKVNDPDYRVATNKHWFWDKVWSRRVAGQVGLQRCHTMISGSAPLDPQLQQFLRICFANNLAQGYGLTETYAIALCQSRGDMSVGNCGGVLPPCEIILRDVPDMEYLSSDKPYPRGELCIRGNTIFREYHKNPAETAKAVDADGWFSTGDIASVDEFGRFKIIDRVKNLLKLSQGEYVSPENIENKYLANISIFRAAYLHGDSDKSCLVGLFDIEPEPFADFAGPIIGKKIKWQTDIALMEEACKNESVRKAAQQLLNKVAKDKKFMKLEYCRALYLYVNPFRVDNNLLTPTMKVKRPQVRKHFREELDQLYAQVDTEDASKPQKALM